MVIRESGVSVPSKQSSESLLAKDSPSNALSIDQLSSYKPEVCSVCKDLANTIMQYNQSRNCPHCQGHGVEPVAVENPVVCKCMCHTTKNLNSDYCFCSDEKCRQLKVSVPFEVDRVLPNLDVLKKDGWDNITLRFLPIRPLKEGDNSVLMVVKV